MCQFRRHFLSSIFKNTILATFYEQLFCTKVFCIAFLYFQFVFLFLGRSWHLCQSWTWNILDIEHIGLANFKNKRAQKRVWHMIKSLLFCFINIITEISQHKIISLCNRTAVNLINDLRAHFWYKILAPKKFKPKTQLCNFWHQNFVRKIQ